MLQKCCSRPKLLHRWGYQWQTTG